MKKIHNLLVFLIICFSCNAESTLDVQIKANVGGYGGIHNYPTVDRYATNHEETSYRLVYDGYGKGEISLSVFRYAEDDEIKNFEFMWRPRIKLNTSYDFLNNDNNQKLSLGGSFAVLFFDTGIHYNLTDKQFFFPIMLKPDMSYYFSDNFGFTISPFIGCELSQELLQHNWYNTARILGGIEFGIVFNPTRKARLKTIKENKERRDYLFEQSQNYEYEKKIENEQKERELISQKEKQQRRSEYDAIVASCDGRNESFAYKTSDKDGMNGDIEIIAYLGDSLETLIIPDAINGITVRRISSMVRKENVSFKKVVIPKSVHEIGDGSFAGCGIENIIFESGSELNKICKDAFRDNKIHEMELPKSVKELGENCFRNNCFTEIPLGKRVIGIYSNVFAENKIKRVRINRYWKIYSKFITESDILEEVYYEDGCIEISERAFEKCSNLKELYIPSSITLLSEYAFCDCTNLKDISFGEGSFQWQQGENFVESLKMKYIHYEAFKNCPLSDKTKSKLMEIGFNEAAF